MEAKTKVMRKVKSAAKKKKNPIFSHLQNLDIWDINQGMFYNNMGR